MHILYIFKEQIMITIKQNFYEAAFGISRTHLGDINFIPVTPTEEVKASEIDTNQAVISAKINVKGSAFSSTASAL